MNGMIATLGPWVGAVGGLLTILGYLAVVAQIKARLDMFIKSQDEFRHEVRIDFETLGTRLEAAINNITVNSVDTATLKAQVEAIDRRLDGIEKGVMDGEGGTG